MAETTQLELVTPIRIMAQKAVEMVVVPGVEGLFELRQRDSNKINLLSPQKRKYIRSDDLMTEASILYGFFGDFYVSLGEPTTLKSGELTDETSWTIRASYKPLMGWVWFGCLLMSLGGGLAMLDKRYFNQKKLQPQGEKVKNPNFLDSKNIISKQPETKSF